MVPQFQPIRVKLWVTLSNGAARFSHSSVHSSSPTIQSNIDSKLQIIEENIEKVRLNLLYQLNEKLFTGF